MRTPLDRTGEADDLAQAVIGLRRMQCGTGQILMVNGGSSLATARGIAIARRRVDDPAYFAARQQIASISPQAKAIRASSRFPVTASHSVRCRPIRRGMLTVPPAPGMRPSSISGSAK